MPARVVVIGASAGGVEALTRVVGDLPPGLDAAVFVVMHFPSAGISNLPRILARSALRVVPAEDGLPISAGSVYVARPGLHLVIEDGFVHLVYGPRENRHRPAVDTLFRSAAIAYAERAIGVVLSGNLDDGTAGLRAIKARGGLAVAQDPRDASFPGMPSSAIAHADVDHVVPLAEIGPLLARLVEAAPPAPRADVPRELKEEAAMSDASDGIERTTEQLGVPSGLTCPECGGVLWEIEDGEMPRYRCRVGHAYSIETLLNEQEESLESTLWVALTALAERAALSRRMMRRMIERGHERLADRYAAQARDCDRRVELLRRVLQHTAEDEPEPEAAALAEADRGAG